MTTPEVLQRRASAAVEQPCATQRMVRTAPAAPEWRLGFRLRILATATPPCAHWRLPTLHSHEAFAVNQKRVQRLRRDEGLRVTVSRRECDSVWTSATAGDRLESVYPNLGWMAEFAFDWTDDGRVLGVLTITDAFTKTASVIEVKHSIAGEHVVQLLDQLAAVHAHPMFVRTHKNPEMACYAIAFRCRFSVKALVFNEPGSPWSIAFVNPFNSKIRDEVPTIGMFHSLLEARVMANDCRQHNSPHRPRSSCSCRTSNEFTPYWSNNNPGLAMTLKHTTGTGHAHQRKPQRSHLVTPTESGNLAWGELTRFSLQPASDTNRGRSEDTSNIKPNESTRISSRSHSDSLNSRIQPTEAPRGGL